MFSFAARFLSLILLALAVVSAVLDVTRSIAASKVIVTSAGQTWSQFSLTSIQAAQGAIQGYVHPLVWDPVIQWILLWPTWLVLGLLSLCFYWLGRRRKRRLGRAVRRRSV
jgi:hypothetical protein